jgi:uridine kinase
MPPAGRPILIGIAGGSGSGKTLVAKTIHRDLGSDKVEPTKRYADIILPEGGHNRVAIDLLKVKIKDLLRERGTLSER